jgi:hypothetical protein
VTITTVAANNLQKAVASAAKEIGEKVEIASFWMVEDN